MSTITPTRHQGPRLCGMAEVVPFSFDQYQGMIKIGIPDPEDAVEWIDGYLVCKNPERSASWLARFDAYEVPILEGHGPLWPFTIEEYEQLIEAGVIPQGPTMELIKGYLVAKDRGGGPTMPSRPRHATGVRRTGRFLASALGSEWVVQIQQPITLVPAHARGAGSEPEPDAAVALGPDSRYLEHHPRPEDILLVVEVADSSLLSDRRTKVALYAQAGITCYWIVNVVDRQLEAFTNPDPATAEYRNTAVLTENQSITLAWKGLTPIVVPVKAFLP